MSMIVADVDHFKSYNDNYGHLAGDSCLKKIAKVIQRKIQKPRCVAARYSGEGFAVLLPETQVDEASSVAERMRLSVQELNIPHVGSDHEIVTLSLGVVARSADQASGGNALLNLADKALYDAKEFGCNRVVIGAP